jgi:S1-C subfamily serine protease
MDTAAEVSGSRFRSSAQAGYAIPIAKARSVADQIESGKASATIHIGLPAFLGVQVDGSGSSSDFGPASGGAPVAGVVPGTPAASIGVAAGDTITSVDGRTVDSASGLSTLLQSARPGDKVAIGWVDQSGTEHTARATLATGPAD